MPDVENGAAGNGGAAQLGGSGGAFSGAPTIGGGGTSTAGASTAGSIGFAGASSGGKQPGQAGEPPYVAGAPNEAGAGGEGPLFEPAIVIWGKRFGSVEVAQHAQAIAVEPDGDFTITGWMFGFVDFGGGALSSPNQASAFLAKFDTDGEPLWSDAYAGSGPQYAKGIDVSDDGALVVVGDFTGGLDFGGGTLQAQGGYDAFVASFEADGSYRYAERFGDQLAANASGVALGAAGEPVVAGHFTGSIDFGGGALAASGSSDPFMVGLQQQGDYAWAMRAGDDGLQRANAVARLPTDDSVIVAGQFAGSLKLGACSSISSQGSDDVWVGWLTGSGECLRAVRFGDDQSQVALAVATAKTFNNAFGVVGELRGTVSFAGESTSAGDGEAGFLALYGVDQSTFTLSEIRLRSLEGTPRAITFDGSDELLVVGDYPGDSGRDVFVSRYDSAGKLFETRRIGGSGDQYAHAVGTDAAGNIYVAGSFEGNMVLSTGTLESAGAEDIFVVKLAP